MRACLGIAIVSLSGFAQDPAPAQTPPAVPPPSAPLAEIAPIPKYEFTGKPVNISFACTEDVLHAVGLSCPESEPCPVFVELAGLESAGGKTFLTGNIHSSAATFSSLLLVSEDNGKTWTEAHERIPQAVLEGVQFADYSSGWAGGQLLTTLPRDPFFLVTTDGGKTWKKRAVYDESKVGAIDSFYFESPRDGMLAMDRTRGGEPTAKGEIYETKTGGESWMLREVSSKPLRLKKVRAPLADLRLRADAASKTYRLEQQQGSRWTLLSSFSVRLSDCKIGARELAPPPEPEPPSEPAPAKPAASKPGAAKPAPSLKKKP